MVGPKAHGTNRLLLLEMGSHRLRALAVVAGNRRGPRICGAAMGNTTAGRDGLWPDPATARAEVGVVLREAMQQAGSPFRQVLLSLGGTHMTLLRSQGRLALKLPLTLRPSHLEGALEAATHLGLPPDREVLHVLPTGYVVDGARLRGSPLGLRARGLVAECAIVTVSRAALDGMEKALGALDCELTDVVAEPLVTARSVVDAEARLRGVILVDLGAERTSATVHRDGVLQGMACIGAGAAHVTRDLAFALQTDVLEAEDLKRRWGVAWEDAASFEVPRTLQWPMAQEGFAPIIEPRMRELLQLLREGLEQCGALAASDRVILTGGGAQLRGTADLAHAVFGLPVRLAAMPGEEDSIWSLHRSHTLRGLLAYAEHWGLPAPAPRWISAVQRLRGAFVPGGERQTDLAHSQPEKVVEVARHGERGTARVGVDSEVHDVRVRTGV